MVVGTPRRLPDLLSAWSGPAVAGRNGLMAAAIHARVSVRIAADGWVTLTVERATMSPRRSERVGPGVRGIVPAEAGSVTARRCDCVPVLRRR